MDILTMANISSSGYVFPLFHVSIYFIVLVKQNKMYEYIPRNTQCTYKRYLFWKTYKIRKMKI